MRKVNTIFISWAPYCSRSDAIAKEFNGKSYMVYYGFLGSNYFTIGLKYFLQMIKTFFILLKEKPDVIFCMNPPIFTCIPVWLYCKIKKNSGFIIDYHTAAFVEPIFKKIFFIQKFFAKRAITNIVTNKILADIIKSWNADYTIIGDVKISFDKIKKYNNFKEGFNVTFVSRYSSTEPIDLVIEAAKKLKSDNINIYITGSLKDAPKDIIKNAPENVIFTDFLDYSEYAGLLKESDVVLCLCTLDNTMQRGAYEATILETPLVISNWNLLKETFFKGAIYVSNTIEGIVNGIKEAKEKIIILNKEIKELKQSRLLIWQENKSILEKKINNHLKNE